MEEAGKSVIISVDGMPIYFTRRHILINLLFPFLGSIRSRCFGWSYLYYGPRSSPVCVVIIIISSLETQTNQSDTNGRLSNHGFTILLHITILYAPSALGNSIHLKSKFGAGYRISIVTTQAESENLKQFVEQYMPEAFLEDDSAGALIYQFPLSSIRYIPRFITWLESKRDGAEIVKAWGISQTTLEEVFLRLIRWACEWMIGPVWVITCTNLIHLLPFLGRPIRWAITDMRHRRVTRVDCTRRWRQKMRRSKILGGASRLLCPMRTRLMLVLVMAASPLGLAEME